MKSANSSLGGAFRHCCPLPVPPCWNSGAGERDARWSCDWIVPFYVGDIVFAFMPRWIRIVLSVSMDGGAPPRLDSMNTAFYKWGNTAVYKWGETKGLVGLFESGWETGRSCFRLYCIDQRHCLRNEGWLEQITFLFLSPCHNSGTNGLFHLFIFDIYCFLE